MSSGGQLPHDVSNSGARNKMGVATRARATDRTKSTAHLRALDSGHLVRRSLLRRSFARDVTLSHPGTDLTRHVVRALHLVLQNIPTLLVSCDRALDPGLNLLGALRGHPMQTSFHPFSSPHHPIMPRLPRALMQKPLGSQSLWCPVSSLHT